MTTSVSAAWAGKKLSMREIVSYGLPRFGSAIMFLAVVVYLPKFYTDDLLLSPALIGLTFLIARFWDAATDPVMGYVSDRTKSRMGRRRPYFLVSAVPVAIAYFLLWSPPHGLRDWGLFYYVTAAYLLTYTFWTIFSIPHHSLGAELTMDYHERTLLTGVREGLGVLGTLVATLAPPAFAIVFGSKHKGYSYLAALTGLTTAVFIFIAFFNLRENPEFQKQHPIALKEGLKALFKNRPFRTLLVAFVIALMGNSLVPVLTLYIADYVVKVPRIAPVIIVSYLLMASVSILFWTRLSRRIGKREAWSYALVLSSVVFAISTYYHEGTWLIWIILAGLAGFGYGCTLALAYSMMADVIDLDELETGRRREGAYFGIWFFVEKGAVGLTAYIGLQTLAIMGYVPNVEQSLRVVWSMKFLYSILPAVCFGACYFFLRRYPITQKEHERIRAEIQLKKGSSRA
ncbi:MAG: MFS transporter [Candidatus Hydrogenedentota bacterium]|nr:MAG: MFS transporter [Candidatus Hydrogenedentota bacterium]